MTIVDKEPSALIAVHGPSTKFVCSPCSTNFLTEPKQSRATDRPDQRGRVAILVAINVRLCIWGHFDGALKRTGSGSTTLVS